MKISDTIIAQQQLRVPGQTVTITPVLSPSSQTNQTNSVPVANLPQTPSISVDISSIGYKLSRLEKPINDAITPQFATPVVDYTNKIKLTRDKTIDAILGGGNFWWNTGAGADGANPSGSADHTLTYSFLTSTTGMNEKDATGFQSLNSQQQDTVRQAFDYISTFADITFTEVAGGTGQLNLGSNFQGGASGGYRTRTVFGPFKTTMRFEFSRVSRSPIHQNA